MRILLLAFGGLSFLIQSCSYGGGAISKPSGILIIDKGRQVVVGSFTSSAVFIADLPWKQQPEWRSIRLPGKPSGMVAAPDGKTVWVTCGESSGMLVTIDVASATVTGNLKIGHYPVAPALNNDGDHLFVCLRYADKVVDIDLSNNSTVAIPVKNEPVALAAVPGKPLLLVAHHRPAGRSTADEVATILSVIDLDQQAVIKEISLPNGSTGIRSMSLSPDGKYAYIPHTLGRYQLPTTQLERGWMNANALSVIDIEAMDRFNTVLLDDLDRGAANPWGVKADDSLIIVAHAGTHEITVIDRNMLHRNLEAVSRGDTVAASTSPNEVPNDLTFLLGYRKRIPIPGNGPRAVDLSGNMAAVACYFSNSVAMINLENGRIQSYTGDTREMSQTEKGEMLFNDADLCFQHWQSCAGCHPDARTDGLNWDLINDGLGNPKNTKSMLFAHVTPPAMITGIRPTAEYAVRSGIRFIQFVERPEQDAVCIDAYLKSLRPIESPYLIDGKLSEAAKRGKTVFRKAGCAHCHYGKYFTDRKLHDVGIADGNAGVQPFDTPTLCEVWNTAPYLYDGRASNIREMIERCNPEKKHGNTDGMGQNQIDDLIEYIMSL